MSNDLTVETVSPQMSVAISTAEIDQQISTARRFPRSVSSFRDAVGQMATLNEAIAAECTYSLPRDQKTITGPSARFAEIIASAWGNCRFGARILGDDGRFITAQGYFHDLERNTAVQFEVRRPIVTKKGFRFGDDMVSVTGNAAASVALRNAVFKGVPKAFWGDLWEKSKRCAVGDERSLAARRVEAMRFFGTMGVSEAKVLKLLAVRAVEDITLEHLLTLRGLITAFKEGETTPEEIFVDKPEVKQAAIPYQASITGMLDGLVERQTQKVSADTAAPDHRLTGKQAGMVIVDELSYLDDEIPPSLPIADDGEGRVGTASRAGEAFGITTAADASPSFPGDESLIPCPYEAGTELHATYQNGLNAARAGQRRELPAGRNLHYKANKHLADAYMRGYDDGATEASLMP